MPVYPGARTDWSEPEETWNVFHVSSAINCQLWTSRVHLLRGLGGHCGGQSRDGGNCGIGSRCRTKCHKTPSSPKHQKALQGTIPQPRVQPVRLMPIKLEIPAEDKVTRARENRARENRAWKTEPGTRAPTIETAETENALIASRRLSSVASWFGQFLFHLDIKKPVVRVAVQVVKKILLQMSGYGHLLRQPQRRLALGEVHF